MKRKLISLAVALLCSVGMWAQVDVTSTYITNADFSSGTPIDNHVCTYGKDMETNSTTYYGAQAIDGWTNASVGVTDEGYAGSKLAGALYEYGGTPWLAGSGNTAPATDPNGNSGKAAGLCAVWGGTIKYTQDVTLPAGSYTVKFQVYNATTSNGSGKLITTNLFGFDANEGTDYYSPATTFAIGKWTTVAVTFNLAAETAGKISMGYVGPSGGTNMPHLFVDNVKIIRNAEYTDCTAEVSKGDAQSDWTGASEYQGGKGLATLDGRSLGIPAKYGTSAVGEVVTQTISGLTNGCYEVELYAMSQNEWNNNGASLNNDKGDAVVVFADGKYKLETYINARRGPGYDSNGGPKAYSISGVQVTNGSLKVGLEIKVANQTEWHLVQIKSLIRTDVVISSIATELPVGGAMSADTWYYFTAGASDKCLSASLLGNIVITTDGTELSSTGGTALTSYTSKLVSGTKYYIKSSTAQTVTIASAASPLAEGTYYFKVAAAHNGTSETVAGPAGKYLSRGGAYGTHATVDTYGLPIEVAVLANGKYTLSPADTKRFYYHTGNWDCYADKLAADGTTMFDLVLNDGKYTIHNAAMGSGKYLKYNNSNASDANVPIFDDGTGTNNGPYILWTVESLSDHATAMQSLKDSQAATAAAAAYASGKYTSLNGITTVSALEAELEANYIKGDFVSPSDIESISEKYQGGQPASGNTTETVYSNTIDITTPGLYKFSMQAFYRAASNEVTQAMHTAGADFPPVVLFFGSAETQIKSVYDEGGLDYGIKEGYFETETVGGAPVQYNNKWYTNGQHNSVIIFQKDYYHNDVYLYVSEAGTYSYGVKYMGFANENMQWFIYSPQSVTITSYAEAAGTDDYDALQDAIGAYDAATWGFESGEYAPYNNVSVLTNIAAAKAIDSNETNSKLLVNSLTTAITLSSANATDVDAIYNGLFATVTDGANYPKGWTRTNSWGQMQSGLSGNYATAYYNQPGSLQYGNQGVYTMPLAAATYKLSFCYRSNENNSNNGVTVSIKKEDDGLDGVVFSGNGSTTDWKMVDTYLTISDAGNYVLTLANDGNTWMTNVSLVKASAQTLSSGVPTNDTYYDAVKLSRTFAKTDRWYTLCAPFTFPQSAFTDVKVLSAVTGSGDEASLSFSSPDGDNIAAGTPCLVKPGSKDYQLTVEGVMVLSSQAPVETIQEDINFVGTFSATSLNKDDNSNAWVVSANKLWNVTSTDPVPVPAYCGYFEVSTNGVKSLSMSFDDDIETGIRTIENGELKIENAPIYNLAGQRVSKAQKGIYIVNGKKVMVK